MTKMLLLIILSISALLLNAAQAKEALQISPENKVLLVAREFIDKEYSELDKTGMKTVILEERESDWVVTFYLPTENNFDGSPAKVATPIILINKKTFEVHKAYQEQ